MEDQLPVEHRLLAAAGRLLDDGGARPGVTDRRYRLRRDQRAVFQRFATYLADLATDPAAPTRSPYCRIVLPPRTGKTVIAGHIIARTGLGATFVVPSRALVLQTAAELERQLPGLHPGVFYGDEKRTVRGSVNVTTYNSLQRHAEAGTLPDAIRSSALIFADEAHHAMTRKRASAMRDAFHSRAVRVALTATPDYDDSQRRLARFYPDLVGQLDLAEALEQGLLAPARVWVAEVDARASEVRLVAGDYQPDELGRIMSSAPFFGAATAYRYQGSNADLPCLVACSTRQQAHDLCAFLGEHRPPGRPAPGLVLGDTPSAERERLLGAFGRGELDTLVQVGVLIEGWNAPRCKLLLDLAPSVSRVRATQKYFRVMTRHGDQEARIYVLLPVDLPRAPVLPMDLLLPPGSLYDCGDLLGDHESKPGGGLRPVRAGRRRIAGVREKKRVLICAPLEAPELDPSDPGQLRQVLRSCPTFDACAPCGIMRFRTLVFHHPLFSGTGAALLRWLGLDPRHGQPYRDLLASVYPEHAAGSFFAARGGAPDELWQPCSEDVRLLEVSAARTMRRRGDPPEALAQTDRALGHPGEPQGLEQLLMSHERDRMLRALLSRLDTRRRRAVELRFGLAGEGPLIYREIGARFGVSGNRARELVNSALRRMRRYCYVEYRRAYSSRLSSVIIPLRLRNFAKATRFCL